MVAHTLDLSAYRGADGGLDVARLLREYDSAAWAAKNNIFGDFFGSFSASFSETAASTAAFRSLIEQGRIGYTGPLPADQRDNRYYDIYGSTDKTTNTVLGQNFNLMYRHLTGDLTAEDPRNPYAHAFIDALTQFDPSLANNREIHIWQLQRQIAALEASGSDANRLAELRESLRVNQALPPGSPAQMPGQVTVPIDIPGALVAVPRNAAIPKNEEQLAAAFPAIASEDGRGIDPAKLKELVVARIAEIRRTDTTGALPGRDDRLYGYALVEMGVLRRSNSARSEGAEQPVFQNAFDQALRDANSVTLNPTQIDRFEFALRAGMQAVFRHREVYDNRQGALPEQDTGIRHASVAPDRRPASAPNPVA